MHGWANKDATSPHSNHNMTLERSIMLKSLPTNVNPHWLVLKHKTGSCIPHTCLSTLSAQGTSLTQRLGKNMHIQHATCSDKATRSLHGTGTGRVVGLRCSVGIFQVCKASGRSYALEAQSNRLCPWSAGVLKACMILTAALGTCTCALGHSCGCAINDVKCAGPC